MYFGILGPLLVRDGDSMIRVPAARQRVLLATLLVHAGNVVPAGVLAEMVWDGAPPTGAAITLRSYVSRLRGTLGPGARDRLVTRYSGYLLQADGEELDLLQFGRLCQKGGAAVRAGDWARAAEMLDEALGLWRGEPLADIPGRLLRLDEAPRLEQLKLQATEWRIDAGLHLGDHGEVVPELQSLTAQHPLRERFHAQLMLALCRCGRQAEALAAYQYARSALIEELGTEPGAELRELQQRVLAGDPALAVASPVLAGAGAIVPRQLPASVPHFTGRAAELATLTELLEQAGERAPRTVVISAISGTAGVGKTALAVYWAHETAERFPDGQLYVNLRGYDPGPPVPAADALDWFLRALGVPDRDIPAETEVRAARYRSLLAGRRMLVVLDNAGSVEQVRPLLPGAPACVVVVTSRDSLAGLVARDGATRLDLDLLPLEEAVGLLRTLIGPRVDADPGAAGALAGQCSRLPLALRVAAEFAAARPAVSLAELEGELADQRRRLDLLKVSGDPHSAVRAVFSWSYRHLDIGTARGFRLAGVYPGPDFDPYAAAALTGTTVERAGQLLDQLAKAHLISPAGPGRYGMHDLLRAYAVDLAGVQDTGDERRVALTRLFDHYLHAAATAMDTLFPAEAGRRPRISAPASPAPPVSEKALARAWLDAERPGLVAAAAQMAEDGWSGHVIRLATILFRYLDVGGHYAEAIAIHSHARRAASQTGDRAAEADALTSLGAIDLRQGRYQQAAGHFGQALALCRQSGDRAGEARALGNLSSLALQQGHGQEATDYIEQTLTLFREAGNRTGEGRALAQLGAIDLQRGRHRQAASHLEQALAVCRETGDRSGEAHILVDLGLAGLRQGRYAEAAGHVGDALTLCREAGDRTGEAEALNSLGEILLASGQPEQARSQHTAALGLTTQTGDEYEQARACSGVAQAYYAAGDLGRAYRYWQDALTLYVNLGAPEAEQIRAKLAGPLP